MPGIPTQDGARPIRLAILDDNPFVQAADGSVHPRAATFHRFAEAVIRTGPFQPARYLVPVRVLAEGEQPVLPPIDDRWLRVTPTAPHGTAAAYLRAAPFYVIRNHGPILRAVRSSDLVWIKAPASNALVTAWACARARVPRFTYVAGSTRAVVGSQPRRGVDRIAAAAAAIVYDGTTRWLRRTGPSIELDADLFTSVLEDREVAQTAATWPSPSPSPRSAWRIAWSGRVAGEKGLEDLLAALAALARRGRGEFLLRIIGDGPQRERLETLARRLGLAGRVEWAGYVGERERYMELLRTSDLFVLPSRAEGVPKSLVEAMGAGLPVIAARAGRTADVVGHGSRGLLVPPADVAALAAAIERIVDEPDATRQRRARALDWAREHTSGAQAARLIAWLRERFPALAWPD